MLMPWHGFRGSNVMRRIGISVVGTLICLAAQPVKAEITVNISKSQQRMSVSVDGTEVYRWPVSTGRRGFATPSGTFHPTHLERHWYSRQYELTPMPWAMFFFRGYAVHGTMEAHNLGHAASHGCVRLRPDNAAVLFSLMHKRKLAETKIVVMNGPLPAPPAVVPSGAPMADAGKPETTGVATHFAKADADGDKDDVAADAKPHRDLGAVASAPEHAPVVGNARAYEPPARVEDRPRRRVASLSYAQDDEAAVLRARQAWLRALAHKYGFNEW